MATERPAPPAVLCRPPPRSAHGLQSSADGHGAPSPTSCALPTAARKCTCAAVGMSLCTLTHVHAVGVPVRTLTHVHADLAGVLECVCVIDGGVHAHACAHAAGLAGGSVLLQASCTHLHHAHTYIMHTPTSCTDLRLTQAHKQTPTHPQAPLKLEQPRPPANEVKHTHAHTHTFARLHLNRRGAPHARTHAGCAHFRPHSRLRPRAMWAKLKSALGSVTWPGYAGTWVGPGLPCSSRATS